MLTPRTLPSGFLLGAATGALATIIVALACPELYIDWGTLPGTLVVIPVVTVGFTAVVALPLAIWRRLTWGAAVAAVLTAVAAGELIFLGSQGTAFARWSAKRHWVSTERRAATEREATERETCRRLLAGPPIPPPLPATRGGGAIAPARPRSDDTQAVGSEAGGPRTGTLLVLDREHCAELLARDRP